MTPVEIVHPLPYAQADGWLQTLRLALLNDPHDHPAERFARWRDGWDPQRVWGARADGRWVGTLCTIDRAITVPGAAGDTRELRVDALTAVSVSATHRRRGLLTRMLGQSLTEAHERGDAVSALMAAEWGIYGRFGYAPAAYSATYRYSPRRRGASIAGAAVDTVRQLEPDEVADVAPGVFAAARRLDVGQLDRPQRYWLLELERPGHELGADTLPSWVVHEGPDGPDGLLAWKATRGFDFTDALGAITVPHLVTASDSAYRDLFGYLSGIDAVGEIELTDRPLEERARWLMADARSLHQVNRYDSVWLRILDVPAALSARSYSSAGQLVLDVVDDASPAFTAGRYLLEVDESGDATCRATRQTADLRLTVQALGSCYLGGNRLRDRTIAGDVEEAVDGAVERADRLFATVRGPWNQTRF